MACQNALKKTKKKLGQWEVGQNRTDKAQGFLLTQNMHFYPLN